jgi:hypothetical protein
MLLCAASLAAAETGWWNKPVPAWTEEDARQVLTSSPWAMTIAAHVFRRQAEDERRDGGNMGQEHGVGFDGVDKAPGLAGYLRSETVESVPSGKPLTVQIRWESALPVRAAEMKARESGPPILPGDGYMIAVYGIPGNSVAGDPKKLGEPLKKKAMLKREGRRDVRPDRVEVFQRADGLCVVYLFPLSAEIQKKDSRVEFDATIGRIAVAQFFDLLKMEFLGNLAL